MKESVEKHKDEVRNMTMILSSPDMLMNLSMQNRDDLPIPELPINATSATSTGAANILDELNE